jgi:membrane protein involved in colicin uptake
MNVKILKPFRDKHTGTIYKVGEKVNLTAARVKEVRGKLGDAYFEEFETDKVDKAAADKAAADKAAADKAAADKAAAEKAVAEKAAADKADGDAGDKE